MILFAHHVEAEHLPVLAVFLVVGAWLGWQAASLLLNVIRPSPRVAAHQEDGGIARAILRSADPSWRKRRAESGRASSASTASPSTSSNGEAI